MEALVFTGSPPPADGPLPPAPLAQPETTLTTSSAPIVRRARRDGVGITVRWGRSERSEWSPSSAREAGRVVGAAGAAIHGAAWIRAERTGPRHPRAVEARCNDALRRDTLLDPTVERLHEIVLRVADRRLGALIAERRRAWPSRAVRHPRHHEQTEVLVGRSLRALPRTQPLVVVDHVEGAHDRVRPALIDDGLPTTPLERRQIDARL